MGTNGKESLIVLDGVTKVFVTDEVETHALSGIQEGRVPFDCRTVGLR